MSVLWIAVVMAAAAPGEPSMADTPQQPPAAVAGGAKQETLTGVDLRNAVRAALRRWARASNQYAQEAAGEFLALSRALQQDDKMARSQRKYYMMKVRGRLLKLNQQIRINVLAQQAGGFGGAGFGGGGQVPHIGDTLIELIQSIVAPATWDVNGGPGSIGYLPSQHVLIIRQMDEVHNDISDLLEQLRRMDR